jgi:hypothetical protein
MVPAAVVNIGITFVKRSAASSTALNPLMVLIEESTSIDCAREIRGMRSKEKEIKFLFPWTANRSLIHKESVIPIETILFPDCRENSAIFLNMIGEM